MKKLIIALFIFALAMMITNQEVVGQTLAGTVSVDSVTAQRGDQIAVGIRLSGNSHDISLLAAPIRYAMNDLQFDSVSFLSSIMTNDYYGTVYTSPETDILEITYLPSNFNNLPSISSPNGLIATLFFTVKDDAGPGNASIYPLDSMETFGYIDTVYTVDSLNPSETLITYDSSNFSIKLVTTQFASPDGLITYYPEFSSGNVAILVPTDIDDGINASLPTEFALSQNYPNPFNPSTVIGFSLPTASFVTLDVYNVLGQKVETLASGRYAAGSHTVEFDASEHTSGLFFYRLSHEKGTETKKMLLIK